MWIFRDGKRSVSTRKLLRELDTTLREAIAGRHDALLDSLIRAGELESGLADCNADAAQNSAALTDLLADTFVRGTQSLSTAESCLHDLAQQNLPSHITASIPEGFAYYALFPADFANNLTLSAGNGEPCAILGIRSIGTTLSAIATAGLKQRGLLTDRITIRPTGHPFDRVTHFSSEQSQWISLQLQLGAKFLVVDEGPGMSGSSFVSVAEALERQAVPKNRIYLAGSREPDVAALLTHDAATRWTRYHWQRVTSQTHRPYSSYQFFGADQWRERNFPAQEWPACWTQMERLKFLSPSGDVLLKFEGLGRFGREVRHRGERLAEAGFSCPIAGADNGMTAYDYVPGSLLHACDLDGEILARIAEYCVFRREFAAPQPVHQQLHEMLCFNLEQEFGTTFLGLDLDPLRAETPIVTDSKMQPYEWIRTRDGRILKLDATTHGDDHFFPGPTDIAWDLAGAIVEWRMPQSASGKLIRHYSALSGDDVSPRLPAYRLAYSVFRMGYCKMASEAETNPDEKARLADAYREYRELVVQQLGCSRRQAGTAEIRLSA